MHLHYRQHLTKHFCGCGYSSASYDSIYQHQHRHCKDLLNVIYNLDRRSYPHFLRHIKWTSAQPFGKCTPTLDSEGRRTLTYQWQKKRKPVRERLREPVAVRRVQTVPSAARDELERLERQATWHDRDAKHY